MSIQSTHTDKTRVQKTPDVCGGEACIRNTRIPVWSIVRALQLGAREEELLSYFVTPLTPADVHAALKYYQEHVEEIDTEIRQNEEA
jgi:type III restriction enzyme